MSTATITGDVGPGKAIAATVFSGVTKMELDTAGQVLFLEHSEGRTHIDISTEATLTFTVTAGVYSLTVAA